MKKSFLEWIFFLICALLLLSSFALENSQKLEQEYNSARKKANYQEDGHGKEIGAEHDIFFTGKGQKGKGSYGGANVVHRRPDKNAASPSYKSSSITFTTIVWFKLLFA